MLHVERRRSLVVAVAAVAAAIAVSSVALAAGGVAGTYAATIKNSNHLNGKWVLVLKGGAYTVAQRRQYARTQGSTHSATATTIASSLASPASGCAGSGRARGRSGEEDRLRPHARTPLLPGTRGDPRPSIQRRCGRAMNLQPVVVVTASLSAGVLAASDVGDTGRRRQCTNSDDPRDRLRA